MENKNKIATEENIHMHYAKIIKWLIVGWVTTMLGLSAIFAIVWCQYDYTGETTQTETVYSQDGEGVNNINTGTQGDVDESNG